MRRASCLAAAAAVFLSACSFAPRYVKPVVPTADTFKETGLWTPAAASDAQARGQWWAVFNDPTLNNLEERAARANATLAAAVAAYDQARALAAQARAGLVPEIDLNGQSLRQQRSENAPLRNGGPDQYQTQQVGLSTAYEIDLWGRIRNQARQAGRQAQASAADLENVRLSLQAQLADAYFSLRGLDAQAKLLSDTVGAYQRALQLNQILHDGGAASGIDVARAQTQLSSTKAQATDVAAQRALFEHAIAVLVGEFASTFSLSAEQIAFVPPVVPTETPSTLLQRRPDIAAAERRAAAANAAIGVATAARFPSLSLTANGGYQTGGGVDLLTTPNEFWMVGPQIAGALFDFGKRHQAQKAAQAAFVQASQNYRAAVLTAFKDVEDQMALANRLADESTDQNDAVTAAERAQDLALIRYRGGATSYLDVITAQAAALTAERAAIALGARRMQASVDLVRAMGGGWM